MGEVVPRVSIGMPVRNGQKYIREAIESILSQTFGDFELIICDNASTDCTEQICREYAARDARIRYFRSPVNIGPAENYNRCFRLCRGQYFRWHAHDDMIAPQYLQKCIQVLEADPTVVLVHTRTLIVDENGAPLDEYRFRIDTDDNRATRRFSQLVHVNHRKHRAVEIFGLMRSDALRRTPLQGAYARGDSVLLVRLALLGRFIELPDRLFLSRSHPSQSMQTLPSNIGAGGSRLSRWLGTGPLPPPEWWDASRRGKANFPEWNLLRQYWASIGRSPLHASQKASCYASMLKWVACNSPKLARDVVFATENLSTRALNRVISLLPALRSTASSPGGGDGPNLPASPELTPPRHHAA